VTDYSYRYYHPELGRWISRDPIGEKGGLNSYVSLDNDPASRIDALGLFAADAGIGGSFTIAITLGGVTGGVEVGIGKTYMVSSSSGDFDCLQCTVSLKLGVGAGELSLSAGFIGSIGDDSWVGDGRTSSTGYGVNFSPDPWGGGSGGFAKSDSGSWYNIGVNSSDPIGLSAGPGLNFYKSKTYAGKVCEKRSCLDPFGVVSSVKTAMRLKECIDMAWNEATSQKWGLPKFDRFD